MKYWLIALFQDVKIIFHWLLLIINHFIFPGLLYEYKQKSPFSLVQRTKAINNYFCEQ